MRLRLHILFCLLAVSAVCFAGESREDLKPIIDGERKARREAAKLLSASHKALDDAHYDAAVEQHRRSAILSRQADDAAESVLKRLLPALDSDDYETRESATQRLATLSRGAIPKLQALAEQGHSETSLRLKAAIALLQSSEEDEFGRVCQWAVEARASTEYTATDWAATQATGKPNTDKAGDATTAWASKEEDAGDEWLELTYATEVRPSMVRVYETFNPGAVKKIEAKDADGNWHSVWEGKDATADAPGKLEVKIDDAPLTKVLKVTLDSASIKGWNEIDAVEMIGEPDEK
jgi:hypothetical protein